MPQDVVVINVYSWLKKNVHYIMLNSLYIVNFQIYKHTFMRWEYYIDQ